MIRRICIVSREYDGIAGAGGLKDVVRGLAEELVKTGRYVTVIIPRYAFVPKGPIIQELSLSTPSAGGSALAMEIQEAPVRIIAIDHSLFSSKQDVYTYCRSDAPEPNYVGKGHLDVNRMNIVFQEAAVLFMLSRGTAPDLIHAHDAHTGLLGCYLDYLGNGFFARTGLLTTIHNAGIAYQQITGSLDETVALTGLPEKLFQKGVQENLVVPFLIASAYGWLNTVSPGYAEELLSGKDEYSGMLGSTLKSRSVPVKGIINGLNTEYWAGDNKSQTVSRERVLGKLASIRENDGLETGIEIFGALPGIQSLWILFHGRLTYQKGLDDVLSLATGSLNGRSECHIIIYGQGDPELEELSANTAAGTSNWTFIRGYEEKLTLDLFRASSWVMVPSRWEPCGQIDMIGQLNGALPVVRRVGGLRKVRNRLDGLSYSGVDTDGLEKKLYLATEWEGKRPGKVRRMRRRAENTIYERRSWRKVLIRGYFPLYRKARKSTSG